MKMDEQQGLRSRVTRLQAIVGHLLSAIDASKVMSRQVLMWEYGHGADQQLMRDSHGTRTQHTDGFRPAQQPLPRPKRRADAAEPRT